MSSNETAHFALLHELSVGQNFEERVKKHDFFIPLPSSLPLSQVSKFFVSEVNFTQLLMLQKWSVW